MVGIGLFSLGGGDLGVQASGRFLQGTVFGSALNSAAFGSVRSPVHPGQSVVGAAHGLFDLSVGNERKYETWIVLHRLRLGLFW